MAYAVLVAYTRRSQRVPATSPTILRAGARARKAAAGDVVLVAGAPCAGKTSYTLANAAPGDLVVDFDRLGDALTSTGWQQQTEEARQELIPFVASARDAVLDRLDRGRTGRTWIVASAPTVAERDGFRSRFGAEVVVVDTPRDVCVDRALAERPEAWALAAMAWHDRYEADARDTVVSGVDP